MASRVIHAFGSSVCEALPVQLVNDIFFLHERGKRLGYYTICLCLGSTGPLYAGFMLNGGYSWRLFFWVEFAFAVALLVLVFFVVEETCYHRGGGGDAPGTPSTTDGGEKPTATAVADALEHGAAVVSGEEDSNIPPRKTFIQTLKFWGVWEHDSDFFVMIARSFTYFLVPHVFWVITTYGTFSINHPLFSGQVTHSRRQHNAGIYIGVGALTFNYIFPLKVVAPPYNWSQTDAGLLAIATIVGYVLAFPFTSSSDRLAARLTKRNGGIREAEMRLGVMLPAMVIAPTGLVLFGMAAERNLHWIVYFLGVAFDQFASYFYFTFTLAYAIDSYQSNISEMLIAMNLGKQAISFGMGIDLIEWVTTRGYGVMIAGVFMALLLANNLALLVFMVWGKRIRAFMARTWLAKVHRSSIREVATH